MAYLVMNNFSKAYGKFYALRSTEKQTFPFIKRFHNTDSIDICSFKEELEKKYSEKIEYYEVAIDYGFCYYVFYCYEKPKRDFVLSLLSHYILSVLNLKA